MLHKLVPIRDPRKETTAFPQPAVESGTTVTLLQSPTVPSVCYCVPTRPGFHHPQAMASPVKAPNSERCNRSVSKPPHTHTHTCPGLFGQGSPRCEDFKGYPGDYDEPR